MLHPNAISAEQTGACRIRRRFVHKASSHCFWSPQRASAVITRLPVVCPQRAPPDSAARPDALTKHAGTGSRPCYYGKPVLLQHAPKEQWVGVRRASHAQTSLTTRTKAASLLGHLGQFVPNDWCQTPRQPRNRPSDAHPVRRKSQRFKPGSHQSAPAPGR